MLRLLPVLCLLLAALPALSAEKALPHLGVTGFERTTFWHVQPGLTDDEIQAHVDALARFGVTGVIIGGGRHHYLHDDLPYLDQQIEVTRRVVKACHARGIRVAEHHSVVLTTRKDYAQAHKDWIQRDFKTGDFSVWPEYQTYAFCPNNPDFRAHYWSILADFVRRTGVDAVMSDDASFHQGCACAACAARWKAEVGGGIREAYKAAQTPGTPAWRQWNAVRQGWYRDFRMWLFTRMRREMPKVQCLSLLGSLLSPWGPQTSGANQEAMLDSGDAGWWEIYNPADFYSWRRNAVEASALYEAGRVRGVDVVALPYADRAEQRDVVDPEEETFMWGLSMAQGLWFTQARVFLTGLTPADTPRPYWNFERDALTPYERAEPAAPVGILFSRRSRDADPHWEGSHSGPAIGWAESLQDADIPYRAVIEETLDKGLPKDIRTLILPDVFALSDAHLARLEKFVRNGGTLVATFQTGTCDESGAPKLSERAERLAALFGARINALASTEAMAAACPRADVTITGGVRRQGSLESYETKLGKGRVVYLPSLVGREALQNNLSEMQAYEDPRKPETVRALASLVAGLTPDPSVTIERTDPDKYLLATLWRKNGALLVHVVNAAGADLAPGAKVPAPSRVVWAPAQDMRLTFRTAPKRIRVLSLDREECRTLEHPGRTVTLRSPHRYALIVAEM